MSLTNNHFSWLFISHHIWICSPRLLINLQKRDPLNHRNYPTHTIQHSLFSSAILWALIRSLRKEGCQEDKMERRNTSAGCVQKPSRTKQKHLSPAKQRKSGLGPRSLCLQSISQHGKMGAGGTVAALEKKKKNRTGCQVLLPPSILQHPPAPRWSLLGVHCPRPSPSGILFLDYTQTQRPSADGHRSGQWLQKQLSRDKAKLQEGKGSNYVGTSFCLPKSILSNQRWRARGGKRLPESQRMLRSIK